ncbi:lariat debranching enzyme [Coemansia sp. RSA 2708]|nr:lariat debranching enzyme [Coemansia sp. RSA 2708]
MPRTLNIAVEGCCHGMLDNIYAQLLTRQQQMKKKVDLLIICGDFQAVRNVTDLGCMSCPDKYKQIGGFYRYYSGERSAPVPTIFVGGNHEASNHMRELYYGGWVAPNIYFMGNSGVVRFGGLRIGGISGIFKDFDYAKGFFERPPFRGHARSAMHHVRSFEAFKMLQIRQPLDVIVSHDWPQFIERYGDTSELLRRKPFFAKEVERGDLGSPVNAMLLERLRPAWWFSAHLHVRFTAQVGTQESIFAEGWKGIPPYGHERPLTSENPGAVEPPAVANENEIIMSALSDEESDNETEPAPTTSDEPVTFANPSVPSRPTKFLALDKCLPRRDFLEIVEIEVPDDAAVEEPKLEYDPEWLAILRLCNPHIPLDDSPFYPPAQAPVTATEPHLPLFADNILARELEWVSKHVFTNGPVAIPPNFVPVAPVPPAGTPDSASFGLARNDGGNRGRGRGANRGRGGRHGYGQARSDAPWDGPRPYTIYPNPQTDDFCKMIGIDDRLTQRRYQDPQ